MTTDILRYFVFGDVHLHHQHTPTLFTIDNIGLMFDNYSAKSPMTQLDLIILNGDLFHRLMYFNHEDTSIITNWAKCFVSFCISNKIELRILKGTPSHDYDQLERLFEPYFCKSVRYIDSIEVEILPTGHSILYIPDEAPANAELALSIVDDIFKQKGITTVDIATMHGAFDYQLPSNVSESTKAKLHKPDEYLKRVKGFISINHIHTASVYQRIVAPGSFDRTAFGEEEPKGAVVFTYDPTGANSYFEFVENKNAHTYKRIVLKSLDPVECIELIDREVAGLRDNSKVQIRGPKGHPLFTNFEQLQLRYLNLRIDKDVVSPNNNSEESSHDVKATYTPLHIHKGNIVSLLLEQIGGKNTDVAVLQKASRLLEELL